MDLFGAKLDIFFRVNQGRWNVELMNPMTDEEAKTFLARLYEKVPEAFGESTEKFFVDIKDFPGKRFMDSNDTYWMVSDLPGVCIHLQVSDTGSPCPTGNTTTFADTTPVRVEDGIPSC